MLSLSVHVERYNFNMKKLMQESIEKLTFKKDINVLSLLSPFGKKKHSHSFEQTPHHPEML